MGISNGTTLAVTVTVNGTPVAVDPTLGRVQPADLPPLPWLIEARTVTGRLLGSVSVAPGQVWTRTLGNGTSESRGSLMRVDLSCGRLDVWVGVPASGPIPGPGVPGDCVP